MLVCGVDDPRAAIMRCQLMRTRLECRHFSGGAYFYKTHVSPYKECGKEFEAAIATAR